jgi:branched-chain amino acid aminotransferase
MITETLPVTIDKVAKSRLTELDLNNLAFGKHFADHMFVAEYRDGQWVEADIMPYGKMMFSPSSSMMHYGQAIFEGLKAYRGDKGEVLAFRPHDNFKRMNISAERMAMPLIPEDIFMEGLAQLLKLDQAWIPSGEHGSLYIRPFYIGTDEYIGVKPSESYKFIIITSPVGQYYTEPVKVLVETNYIRAVEGGVGYVKNHEPDVRDRQYARYSSYQRYHPCRHHPRQRANACARLGHEGGRAQGKSR